MNAPVTVPERFHAHEQLLLAERRRLRARIVKINAALLRIARQRAGVTDRMPMGGRIASVLGAVEAAGGRAEFAAIRAALPLTDPRNVTTVLSRLVREGRLERDGRPGRYVYSLPMFAAPMTASAAVPSLPRDDSAERLTGLGAANAVSEGA